MRFKSILTVIGVLLVLLLLSLLSLGLMFPDSVPVNVAVVLLLLVVFGWLLSVYSDYREGRQVHLPQPPLSPIQVSPAPAVGVLKLLAKYLLGIFATCLALAFLGVLMFEVLPVGFIPFNLAVLLLLAVVYTWMLSAYLHYRQGRQAEFQHLLTTAAESGAPLAPALRAYARDRPRGAAREIWVACLLFFVVPGYYWVWHRRHNYDRLVARVADRLEQGCSLHDALLAVPGVLPREAILAVKIGESTGQLARCLRASTHRRLATLWVEIIPGLIYPLVLLLFVSLIVGFWGLFLLPKMEKIYRDFGEPLPDLTRRVARLCRSVGEYGWLIILGVIGALQLGVILQWSSRVRWYFPGLSYFYRMNVQSRVLRMLGVLLGAGRPAPEALGMLADSDAFGPGDRERLDAAREHVEQGSPLAESLQQAGLLRPAMVPLVQAAQRVHNLPWAMTELGESLLNRLIRFLKKTSMVIFPVNVLAVGLLVGFLVIGMFLPLIRLIEKLSQ